MSSICTSLFRRGIGWFWLGSALLLLAACGSGRDPEVTMDEATAGIGIRTPHPTFTPTPGSLASAPVAPLAAAAPATAVVAPPTATSAPLAEPTTPTVPTPTTAPEPTLAPTATALPTATTPALPEKALLVINSSDVNVRSGPGTEFDILIVVNRGQEYEVVGKDDTGGWWQVCCVDGEVGWVTSEFADTDGPVDQVAVTNGVAPTLPPTGGGEQASAATVAATEAPTVTAATFDLIVQEQFPEDKQVRIFLYVYDKDQGLEGYSLRVTRDGAELRIKQTSFGGSPGLTWPVADVRQRSQNLKVEFPGITASGQWVVQLVKDNVPVGPAATFTLATNDPNQELYVRYQKRP